MMSSKAKAARVVVTLEFRNHYLEVESDCKRDKRESTCQERSSLVRKRSKENRGFKRGLLQKSS